MTRPVTIAFVANGFTVTVGCQTFVFNGITELVSHLTEYLVDPIAKTKQMERNCRNMQFTNDGVLTPTGIQEQVQASKQNYGSVSRCADAYPVISARNSR